MSYDPDKTTRTEIAGAALWLCLVIILVIILAGTY